MTSGNITVIPLRICPACGSTYCKHWQGRGKPYALPGDPYGDGTDRSRRQQHE